MIPPVKTSEFYDVGHPFFALLAAWVGGMVARVAFENRERSRAKPRRTRRQTEDEQGSTVTNACGLNSLRFSGPGGGYRNEIIDMRADHFLLGIDRPAATAQRAIQARDSIPSEPVYVLSDQKEVIWCAVFSADSQTLLHLWRQPRRQGRRAARYDLSKGKPVQRFLVKEPHGIRWIAIAPGGRVLATAEYDGTSRCETVRPARSSSSSSAPGRGAMPQVQPRRADAVHMRQGLQGQGWDLATTKVRTTISGHSNHVYSLDVSRDERTLLTGCKDATAVLWDVATGQLKGNIPGNKASIEVVRYSPDGTIFAVAGWDWVVDVWDVAKGAKRAKLQSPEGRGPGARLLARQQDARGRYGNRLARDVGRRHVDIPGSIPRTRGASDRSRFRPTANCSPRPATTGRSRSGRMPAAREETDGL